ncbi:hypothetical protein PAXRUDRAFT_13742 [Paxillus rubicundulus Ve08.2h10]|uniref:Uncharacterized protein n=1 Tax=Paxillus rubicundulus Ve08.2h10 TaxID=930991 RepID=A0A0D0DT14_9AGAM|nr:hypothetical protein PAXRUDRAFT_13742 [Paxillus rubicundulus Ve08.2h10]
MGEVKPPDDDKIEEDKTKSPRDPVGTTDSNNHHPNIPMEPPNKEGAQGGNAWGSDGELPWLVPRLTAMITGSPPHDKHHQHLINHT